jgi:hypothetical protein
MKNDILKYRTLFFVFTILFATQLSAQKNSGSDEKKSPLKGYFQCDIGTNGNSKLIGDDCLMTAGGADIWGKHDAFGFIYKPLKGNFDIMYQIKSLKAAHAYTKAGIMARANLSDSSQHVYFQVFPDNRARNKNDGGCEFQYRQATGGDMKAVYPADAIDKTDFLVTYPNTYLRLVRKGDNFEAYLSNDGTKWLHYTTFTQAMPSKIFVGMAVTAHHKTATTDCRFKVLHKQRKTKSNDNAPPSNTTK